MPTDNGNRPNVRARLGISMNLEVVTNNVHVMVTAYLRELFMTGTLQVVYTRSVR